MDVTAKATRSGDWWAVEVPEIPGLFTQAKRLDQVEEMVADAAAMLGHDEVSVTVVAELDEADARLVDDAIESRRRLAMVEQEAAGASRAAITRLAAKGLPMRDVGALMDISAQRVSQLRKATRVATQVNEATSQLARLNQKLGRRVVVKAIPGYGRVVVRNQRSERDATDTVGERRESD